MNACDATKSKDSSLYESCFHLFVHAVVLRKLWMGYWSGDRFVFHTKFGKPKRHRVFLKPAKHQILALNPFLYVTFFSSFKNLLQSLFLNWAPFRTCSDRLQNRMTKVTTSITTSSTTTVRIPRSAYHIFNWLPALVRIARLRLTFVQVIWIFFGCWSPHVFWLATSLLLECHQAFRSCVARVSQSVRLFAFGCNSLAASFCCLERRWKTIAMPLLNR